jgi:hypothetical protein
MQGSHVGETGTVVTRIRGAELPGEVRIVHRGVPHTFLAYAAEPLPVDTPVLVIAMLGPGKVAVERWDVATVDTVV